MEMIWFILIFLENLINLNFKIEILLLNIFEGICQYMKRYIRYIICTILFNHILPVFFRSIKDELLNLNTYFVLNRN